MTMQQFFQRLEQLETRIKEQDGEIACLRAENEALRQRVAQLEAENWQLKTENQWLEAENQRLKELLREKGESKKSKTPSFPTNYSVKRNEPGDKKSTKRKKKRKPSTGRVPNSAKGDKVDQTIEIHPNGVIRNDHVIHRERRVLSNKYLYL